MDRIEYKIIALYNYDGEVYIHDPNTGTRRWYSVKIAICEDELHWSNEIKKSVSRWAINRNIEMQCNSFRTPGELLHHLTISSGTDLVLLDICLGNEVIDGIVTAKHIRKMGNQIPIIFVTVDSFRATDGYLVEAMGFLVKPIDEKRLALFLDRILRKKKNERIIKIVSDTTVTNVPQSDIVYAEVNNHTIIYHTIQKQISLRGTLSNIMETLGRDNFIQVHRSFVVAKAKIYKIKSTYPYSVDMLKGIDTINLSVSRSYIDNLLAEYSDDMLERLI